MAPTTNLVESPPLNRVAEEIATQKGKAGDVTHQKPRVINTKVAVTSKIQGKIG